MITCLSCNVQFIDDRKDKVQSHWNRREGMVKKDEVVKLIQYKINHHGAEEAIKGQILDDPRHHNDKELFAEINEHRAFKKELTELLTQINEL
ncbi:hypothetical protein MuYL_2483 [Mucilaginibacter xinganensis]|uniref:Uncharacterized protein n=2 Tax=Mucilaginibacter xinganensis TaxID=1234841 RepID=A0A223NX55_9SPHI|nr:hypothetical protein MuYL_2483 [Mucilaginibacter xinganensis]